MNHSPLPWKLDFYSGPLPDYRFFQVITQDGQEFIFAVGGKDEAQVLENMDFILKCVNATLQPMPSFEVKVSGPATVVCDQPAKDVLFREFL